MSDYDALTELFLSEGGPAIKPRAGSALRLSTESPAQPAGMEPAVVRPAENELQVDVPSRQPSLEGLILGHLPVLGSAWVTQYAKHVAESLRQPVAILRWQGGQAWIDVVTPRAAPHAPQSRVGAMGSEDESLEKAMAAAIRRASHWLIRVDDISEPDLLALSGLSSVTLLTGADDAAVVASYQSMKGLCQLATEREAASGSTLTIGLAIMGADEEKASVAEAKLRRAGATFLGREVGPAARVAKIGACSTTAIFRGQATIPLHAAVEMIMGQAVTSVAAQPDRPTATAASSRADGHRSSMVQIEPKLAESESRMPAQVLHAAAATTSAARDTRSTVSQAPGDALLASHRPIPDGLTSVPASCPYAPGVWFAADRDGGIHLLQSISLHAVQDLIAAAAWATEHGELLATAYPALKTERMKGGPTLHMFTEDARAARGLLETAIRVHLVVSTTEGMLLKPLN